MLTQPIKNSTIKIYIYFIIPINIQPYFKHQLKLQSLSQYSFHQVNFSLKTFIFSNCDLRFNTSQPNN
jgi:hypothetical protein